MIKVNENFFIGSKNRKNFPMSKIIKGATLFIEPNEKSIYNKHKDNFNIVLLKENNRGFGYLINSMIAYAIERKFEHYIFCDDDILGFKYKDKNSSLQSEIENMTRLMRENKYSQMMMSFIGHNWYFNGKIKEKVGCWCFIINKTSDLNTIGGADENLKIFNDWDISAKLIKSKYKTACYYDAMFIHKMKSQQGGAEEIYKNKTILKRAIAYLKMKYGNECIKEKIIHNQPEARFLWRKL